MGAIQSSAAEKQAQQQNQDGGSGIYVEEGTGDHIRFADASDFAAGEYDLSGIEFGTGSGGLSGDGMMLASADPESMIDIGAAADDFDDFDFDSLEGDVGLYGDSVGSGASGGIMDWFPSIDLPRDPIAAFGNFLYPNVASLDGTEQFSLRGTIFGAAEALASPFQDMAESLGLSDPKYRASSEALNSFAPENERRLGRALFDTTLPLSLLGGSAASRLFRFEVAAEGFGLRSLGAPLAERIVPVYQQAYERAASRILGRHEQGLIKIPQTVIDAGIEDLYVKGLVDRAATRDLRAWLRTNDIAEGPGGHVQINRQLRNPNGTDYVRPDIRIAGERIQIEGTLGTKGLNTPQIQRFINYSGGERVVIVTPYKPPKILLPVKDLVPGP